MNEPLPVRVVRGGSWSNSRVLAGAVNRFGYPRDSGFDYLGFRVMRAPGVPAAWCVLRGGSWFSGRDSARTAYRNYDHSGGRDDDYSFRVMQRSL